MIPAPLCDVQPEHGAMQTEHIYHIDGTVNKAYGLYWFCAVPGCEGWGGLVEEERKIKRETNKQMELFTKGG